MNNGVTKGAIIRTILLLITLANTICAMFGLELLPVGEQEVETAVNAIYAAVSAVVLIVVSLIAWWKNNSFTKEARSADTLLETLKNRKRK